MADTTSLTTWQPNQGGEVNIKLAAGLQETLVGEVEFDRQVLDRVSNRAIAVRQVWGDRLSFVSRQRLKNAILQAERWRDVQWKNPVSLPGALKVRELMEQFVASETAQKDTKWRAEALISSSADRDSIEEADIFQFFYGDHEKFSSSSLTSIEIFGYDVTFGVFGQPMWPWLALPNGPVNAVRIFLSKSVKVAFGEDIKDMRSQTEANNNNPAKGHGISKVISLLIALAESDFLSTLRDRAELLLFCLSRLRGKKGRQDYFDYISNFKDQVEGSRIRSFGSDSSLSRVRGVHSNTDIGEHRSRLICDLDRDLELMQEVLLANRSGMLALVVEADKDFIPTEEEIDFARSILGLASGLQITENFAAYMLGNGEETSGLLIRGPSPEKSLCQFIRKSCDEGGGLKWANAEYLKYLAEEGLEEPHVDETFSPIPETTNRKVAELADLTVTTHRESKAMMASIDVIVQHRREYKSKVLSFSQGTYGALVHVDSAARVSVYAGIDDRPDNPFILYGKARLHLSKHLGLFELAMRDVFVSKLKKLNRVSLRALRAEFDPQTVAEKELVTEIALTLADHAEVCVSAWQYNSRFAKAMLSRETSGPWEETWINKTVRRRRGLKFVFDDTLFVLVNAEMRNESILSLTLGPNVYKLRNVPGSYSRYVKTRIERYSNLKHCEVVFTRRLELEVD